MFIPSSYTTRYVPGTCHEVSVWYVLGITVTLYVMTKMYKYWFRYTSKKSVGSWDGLWMEYGISCDT